MCFISCLNNVLSAYSFCSVGIVCSLYFQYACGDTAVQQGALFLRSLTAHSQVMEVMVRQVRLRRAATQKVANLRRLLNRAKEELEVAHRQLAGNLQDIEEAMADGKCA